MGIRTLTNGTVVVDVPYDLPEIHHDEMIAWCTERFGATREFPWYNHEGAWGVRRGYFIFESANDAFEFKMRWG